jgi:hypothetical protein
LAHGGFFRGLAVDIGAASGRAYGRHPIRGTPGRSIGGRLIAL